jgi:hypothetical protein
MGKTKISQQAKRADHSFFLMVINPGAKSLEKEISEFLAKK